MSAPKVFNWNHDKNQLLIRDRGISKEYPGQHISMVQVDDYVYAVPFVETETEIFLKTIIPSRKARRTFRRKP
jgi:hypothetical protein